MKCGWCGIEMPAAAPPTARWCSTRCRQTAFRVRKIATRERDDGAPILCAYADPPYPGLARRYYGDQPNYAGEVDHAALIDVLESRRRVGVLHGWALSTSAKSLRDVLPLCPPTARVCAWVKPIGASTRTRGIHNTWEPVIVVPGRERRPGVRDWLAAQPARGGGDLMGRKPIAFCVWLFDLLGMQPGDSIDDLFPGTGIVAQTWREVDAGAERRRTAIARSVSDGGTSSSPGGDDAGAK